MVAWWSPQDLVGTTLDGRFELIRLIGKGGMGAVYEARHVHLDHRVAVKVLGSQHAGNEQLRKRFLREARATVRIGGDHVTRITDFGEQPVAFFVMEYLEGTDLAVLMRTRGKLAWSRARPITLQIIKALRAAHQVGIVHRDVKPANVFIVPQEDGSDFVKVLDFGIAKVADSTPEARITRTDEVLGTFSYIAPEQALARDVDARTDVYSLGVVLYEMLAGRVPFTGVNAYQLIDQHVRVEPPRPRSIEPSVPQAVEDVILRAIAKRPADRFQTMDELREAIERIPPDAAAPDAASSPSEGAAPVLDTAVALLDAAAAPIDSSARTQLAVRTVVYGDGARARAAMSPDSGSPTAPRSKAPPPEPAERPRPHDADATDRIAPMHRSAALRWLVSPLAAARKRTAIAGVIVTDSTVTGGRIDDRPVTSIGSRLGARLSVAGFFVVSFGLGAGVTLWSWSRIDVPVASVVSSFDPPRDPMVEQAAVVLEALTTPPAASPPVEEAPGSGSMDAPLGEVQPPTLDASEPQPPRQPPPDAALEKLLRRRARRCNLERPVVLEFQVTGTGTVVAVRTTPRTACVVELAQGLAYRARKETSRMTIELQP